MTTPPPTQPLSAGGGGGGDGWVLGGRYRVIDRIGAGGMAEVFRAHDELLDRDVAVKVFRHGMDEPDGTSGEARRALELQSLARLNHPNLITLFDGSMTSEPNYLVMELVDGTDLAVRLREGRLSAVEVREIGAQIASALAYVHAQGLVHRDVKPANILLGAQADPGGTVRARLSDFGVVRLVGSPRMTSAALTMGTASYIAPEQARGGDVSPPADVYALGLVLIEALTGRRCFDGPVVETMAARLARPPDIPSDLPPPWPQLLAGMTALDPAARPTAAQVAQVLRGPSPTATAPTEAYGVPLAAQARTTMIPAAGAGAAGATTVLPPAARPPAPVPAGEPPRRRGWNTWSVWLAIILLLIVIIVVVLALTSGGGSSGGGGGSTTPPPSSSSRTSASSSTKPSSASSRPSSAASTRTSSSSSQAPTSSASTPTQPSSPTQPSTPTQPSSKPSTPSSSASSPSDQSSATSPAAGAGPSTAQAVNTSSSPPAPN